MINIVVIAAAYFAAVHMVAAYNWRVKSAVLLAVGLPFVVAVFTNWILLQSIPDVAVWQSLFGLGTMLTLLLNLVVATVVFKQLRDNEAASFGWTTLGAIVLVVVIPFVLAPRLQAFG